MGGCFGDGGTDAGRDLWNIEGTRTETMLSLFTSKEPHDGQSFNGLYSVFAHRGGGCIQPRICPVPRRCRWKAHPSSKGRGSNYDRSRHKRGPSIIGSRTGTVEKVIGVGTTAQVWLAGSDISVEVGRSLTEPAVATGPIVRRGMGWPRRETPALRSAKPLR